jgi:uncharacterized membrane protein (DUF373 family)
MLRQATYIKFLKKFTSSVEKIIITILIFMMSIVLIFATAELVYSLIKGFLEKGTFFIISLDTLMDTFGGFLLILIGIELLETIKIYLKQNIVHVEVVVLVAIIALARKIVILKIEDLSLEIMAGIGILVLTLSIAYYLIKKTGIMILTLNENCDNDEVVEQQNINNIMTP